MAPEACAVCGSELPVGSLAHLTVHTKGEEGVVDFYVCRACYESELRPILAPDEPGEETADADREGAP